METLLEKLLSKVSWLNLGSGQLVAEFSAHIGWSLGYLFIAHRIFGESNITKAAWAWVAYSVYKELIEDGHLKRMLNGTESPEETKDLITDLISRSGAVLLFIALA